ncbi:protein hook homolog [Plodia interpunctella]|uniref:protein hook homolog n=1 Tax=Plodia interpunctella TaxID=58824 RepID=UPI00236776F5|nr:protein hook homolog [Plodia interpunctella]
MENQFKMSKTDVDKMRDKIERVHSMDNISKSNMADSLADSLIFTSTDEINVTKLKLNIQILENTIESLKDMICQEKNKYELHKREGIKILSDFKANALNNSNEINRLKCEILRLVKTVEEQRTQILELRDSCATESLNYGNLVLEKMNLKKKYNLLHEELGRNKGELYQRNEEIDALNDIIAHLKTKLDACEQELVNKNEIILNIAQDRLVKVIGSVSKELLDEQKEKERCMKELEERELEVESLKKKLGAVERYGEAVENLMKENEALVKTGAITMSSIEKIRTYPQCNTSASTESPIYSQRIISALQKIIIDKDRVIRELQSEIASLKPLSTETNDELLELTEEMQVSIKNINQVFDRLNKVVHQVDENNNEDDSSEKEF